MHDEPDTEVRDVTAAEPLARDGLLTSKEVAEQTGWDRTTIVEWAAQGLLPYARKLPGKTGAYLFDPQVVRDRINPRSPDRLPKPKGRGAAG